MSGWLITGAGGQLGRDLVAELDRSGHEAAGLSRASLDITDPVAVRETIGQRRPDVVVNCAAWTAVDDAEAREEAAWQVNAHGAANVAAASAAVGACLVQISTDYVFSGDATRPYAEDAPPAPRTAYGRSKLAGERAVADYPGRWYVLRTAWLYGAHGPNFVHAMIDAAHRRPTVDVVADQHGQPSWTVDVAAQAIAVVAARAQPGVYHATSSGQASWFALAREVFRLLDADPARVRPVSTSAFPRPAPRPAWSVLGHDRHTAAGLAPIGDWRSALHRAFPALASGRRGLLSGAEG